MKSSIKWIYFLLLIFITIVFITSCEPKIEEPKIYEVGDIGPAGGYIFYVNDSYSDDGWRYLEVSAEILNQEADNPEIIFGYYRPDGGEPEIVGTEKGIGKGKSNTEALVAKMGENAYLEFDGDAKGEYAAKLALDYSVTVNGINYDDWFLPSLDELNQMYENLKGKNLEGFPAFYWSSFEVDKQYSQIFWFKDEGSAQFISYRSNGHIVRPIRAF